MNHPQIIGASRLYAKVKHEKGSFHPFKGTANNSKIQKDVFNLKSENSQNKETAEPRTQLQ